MPQPPHHAIAELTAAMAEGSEAAFREFHSTHFPRLFRYVLVLMRGNEHAARDVTQETLLRVVRHVRRFDQEKTFWDWLALLARSAAADHGRSTSRYRRLLNLFAQTASPTAPPPVDTPLLTHALKQGFSQLNEADQSLLKAKYEAGASVRSIALCRGLTEEAIESSLARARKRLRAAIFTLLHHET